MRKNLLVNMGVVCALIAPGLLSGMGLGSSDVAWAAPAAESNSLPISGDGAAFATTADGMVSTIESFMQVKDFASAENAAVELTESKPEFLKGWMLLGYCQSRNSRFSESNTAYEKALTLGADTNAIKSRMAYNYIRLGKFDSARDCYRAILELRSSDAESLKQLGYLEGKLGNYDDAAHYYRRILETDPENTEVICALAKIEEKRGGNGVVRELTIKHLELNPDDTESLARLARIYIKEKNFKEAVGPLDKLVTLEPENVNAWRNLGVAHYQLGDKRRAAAEFQKVKDLGGDMSELYGPLADCYYDTGSRSDALVVVKEGIEAGSQEAWLYCMWGKILESRHNYDGAISRFAKAAGMKVEPWSAYARKQITRQEKLKKRAQMISSQQGMN
jgi:Flp pilus assembly protein TadD